MNSSKRKTTEAALVSAEALMASVATHIAVLKATLADVEEDDLLLDLSAFEEDDPDAHAPKKGEPRKKRRKAGSLISASTARSWIKSGRLVAHQAERGRFVFTESALRAAIEAAPVKQRERPARTEPATLDAWEQEADRSLRLVGAAQR